MASLIFEHLKKVYPNGFVSVDDVSLSIEDGEFVVFHGPSGCGKSTILSLIAGLIQPNSGKIAVSAEIGYMLQKDHLLDWLSIKDNIFTYDWRPGRYYFRKDLS